MAISDEVDNLPVGPASGGSGHLGAHAIIHAALKWLKVGKADVVEGKVPREQLPQHVQSVAGRDGEVVLDKADVGLSNVDNTSDADKPVSAAAATALDMKADLDSLYARVPMNQIPADLAPHPMVWRTDQDEGDTFSMTTTGSRVDTIVWRFDGRVVGGSAPSHTWETDGPHVVMCHLPQGLTGSLHINANRLSGDLSQVALPQGLTGNLNLNNNQLTGDLSKVALPQRMTGDVRLHANQLSGDLAEVALPQGLTGTLHLHINHLTGDLSKVAFPQGLTGNFHLYSNQLTGDLGRVVLPQGLAGDMNLSSNELTGALDISQCPGVASVNISNNALTSEDVDATLRHVYDNRSTFTRGGHSLHIGGNNAAPSGTYQAPADPNNPTGKEAIYVLAENPDGEDFLPWQITYTGGTAG